MTEDYQVKNEEVQELLRKVAEKLKDSLPKSLGFTLMLFDYGDKGNMFYISSAQRKQMIESLYEFIAILKKTN